MKEMIRQNAIASTLRGMFQAALVLCLAGLACAQQPNTLTTEEKQAGWKLLFDGTNLDQWRSFKKDKVTATNAWIIEDGWLKKVQKVRGGDIISREKYDNFELSWEWRLPAKGNNGIKYFILEERGGVGHEYQMIDDSTQGSPRFKTGSFYEVLPPAAHKPIKFAPEFNHSKLIVQGNHVEHWLNGEKVVEYECGSKEVLDGVAKSKFKNVQGFGTKIKGHILLTDHNDECSFRNIKILIKNPQ